jgi:hypothetical protein
MPVVCWRPAPRLGRAVVPPAKVVNAALMQEVRRPDHDVVVGLRVGETRFPRPCDDVA